MAQKQLPKASTLAGVSPRSGVAPPADRQFGKKNGNKRGRGFWKKEDTARFKLEQMMKLTASQLQAVAGDPNAPLFDRKLAECIYKGQWKELEGMINQVYGFPKQQIDNRELPALTPILPKLKPKRKKNEQKRQD